MTRGPIDVFAQFCTDLYFHSNIKRYLMIIEILGHKNVAFVR